MNRHFFKSAPVETGTASPRNPRPGYKWVAGYSEAVKGYRTVPPVPRAALPPEAVIHRTEGEARAAAGDVSQDTRDFLESLLFTAVSDDRPHVANWTLHEFHPEFTAAVESFCDGFRAYLSAMDEASPDSDVYADPDAGDRSFGGNVYFSLSGHGCGFWDDSDSEFGDAMQAALESYSGSKYRFEELDCSLMKFNGKIHLAYRTAAYRREYLAKLFTVTR